MKTFLIGVLLTLTAIPTMAAGPDSIAKADRSLWPDPIESPAGFDRASRAEIFLFANALSELSRQDDATLKNALRIKSIDRTAIERVQSRLMTRLLENMKTAQSTCVAGEPFCQTITSMPALVKASHELAGKLAPKYRPWFDNANLFHRIYAGELVRLAALFPKVSSEVDTFGPPERSGFELPDRHFLWTFDDGPSNKGGSTDALLPVLEQNGIHGMFYLLGDRLKKRLQYDNAEKLQNLFAGQCLALHGWAHESHQKWDQWQTSILDTQHLVKETWPNAYRPYFRPPYGQRRSDSGQFFIKNNLSVALWNIDSQDWNAKVSHQDAAQRVLTLMLLWRSGVILFHDVHTKAVNAVPWIVNHSKNTGVVWDDCRKY